MNNKKIKLITAALFVANIFTAVSQLPFNTEAYLKNKTMSYEEVMAFYSEVSKNSGMAKMFQLGSSDVGKPMPFMVISYDGIADPETARRMNKRVVLINNAIHAGEPDGVDASVKLITELIINKSSLIDNLKNVVLVIIPVYNIDGALNRGCCSRVNQEGPDEYGFRANARNLDLNRDFIKCDSENAKAFAMIFQRWNPDVFIDTHTTNGADYQYTMTVIPPQKDKLHPLLSSYVEKKMLPSLFEDMKKKNVEMSPFIDPLKETPDDGIVGFLETPRYSTGYAALFNCIGFTSEAHMLKPFKDRVLATYEFLLSTIRFVNQNSNDLKILREQAIAQTLIQQEFPLKWEFDSTQFEMLDFKGYTAVYKPSEITGQKRLYYDRSAPYQKQVPYFHTYKPTVKASKPDKYIIPQAWKEVTERLEFNEVRMMRLPRDTVMLVKATYISEYQTTQRPYEGHYLHYNVKTREETQEIQFHSGDYVVELNQPANRFIVEVLEPEAVDSYFSWNFFDEILQQKEHFSDYVFEDKAKEILDSNPDLKKEFETWREKDPGFAQNAHAQLDWIYKHSSYYEKSHMRYPVYKQFKQ